MMQTGRTQQAGCPLNNNNVCAAAVVSPVHHSVKLHSLQWQSLFGCSMKTPITPMLSVFNDSTHKAPRLGLSGLQVSIKPET
jgi:hypothetical protein